MPEKTFDPDDVAIQNLRTSVAELSDLAHEMINQVKFKESDHLGFMEGTFVCKQLEHLKSISVLVGANQNRDAWVLSRIMLEGLAILDWVALKPELAFNWKAYGWVEQFKRSYSQSNYPENRAETELMLNTCCRQYLKPGSKDKPQEKITPNDYLKNWKMDTNGSGKFIEKRIKEIFNETGLGQYYEAFYTTASGWLHWDSLSIAEAIQRGADGRIMYGTESKHMGGAALTSGFIALLGSAGLLNDHLNLGFSDHLRNMALKGLRAKDSMSISTKE